jgi:hypothetical protein
VRLFIQDHIREFLTYFATERHVASSTRNQALNPIVFLYRAVLEPGISPVSRGPGNPGAGQRHVPGNRWRLCSGPLRCPIG